MNGEKKKTYTRNEEREWKKSQNEEKILNSGNKRKINLKIKNMGKKFEMMKTKKISRIQ